MSKNNRLFLLIFMTIIFISTKGIIVNAETDGDFEYTLSEDKATITAYTKVDSVTVIVPETVDGDKTVIAIDNEVFKDKTSITNITIPNSITTIGTNAFQDCNDNLILTCPDWNVPVMEYAISNNIACTADNVDISKTGVLSGNGGYYNGSVDHLIIPYGVIEIAGDSTFYSASFTSVTIPNTVREIRYGAFYESDLQSVTIPSGVTTIASDVFGYCASLTSVSIPDTVTNMGDHVFRMCQSLVDISLDENNPNYSSRGGKLLNKTGNTLLEYPAVDGVFTPHESITSIGNGCFYDSTKITGAIIKEDVTSIGAYAFYRCANLESIYLSNTINSIGGTAFYDNDKLTNIIVVNDNLGFNDSIFLRSDNITNVWCNENSGADAYFGLKAKRPLSITNMPDSAIIGDSIDLDYEVISDFSDCKAFVDESVTWSSSDNNVASIDSNTGEILCIGIGTTDITVQREDGLKTVKSLTVDVAPRPIKPSITGITPDTGYDETDGITKATTLQLIGTAEVGSIVELYESASDGGAVGLSSTTNNSGEFSIYVNENTYPTLMNSTNNIYVRASKNGLQSEFSEAYTLTIDTTLPYVSVNPTNGSTDIGLYPTAVLTFDESVREYYNGLDITEAYLNTRGNDESNTNDVFDIDSVNQSRNVHGVWTVSEDRKVFTVTPKDRPLLPGVEYKINITQVDDYAGNQTNKSYTTFTTTPAQDCTEDDISLVTSVTGITYSENGNDIRLNCDNFDLTNTDIITELENLKGNGVTYGDSRLYNNGGFDDRYACVVIRVTADTEYENVYINNNTTSEEWYVEGTVSSLGGVLDGKSYVDICFEIAYKDVDTWDKCGGINNRRHIITFANSDGSTESRIFKISYIHDNDAPEDYCYSIDQNHINSTNADNVSFTLSEAEIGSTCYYTISDGDNSTDDVTGSLEITSEDMNVNGIDVSSLNDGGLIFEVSLKDSGGNIGEIERDGVEKNTSLPIANILTYVDNPTYLESIPVAIQFDKDVTDFNVSDLVITNGLAKYFNGSRKNYNFEVEPIDTSITSTITIDIPEDVCNDNYGNPNDEATSFNINYIPNEEPIIKAPIEDIDDADIGKQINIDLSDHFTDNDGDTISYSYESYLGHYPTGEPIGLLDGSIWTFTPLDNHVNNTYRVNFRGTDNKAASPTTEDMEIRVIDRICITAIKEDVSTYGGNNGNITVSAINGEGTYEYSKDNGNTWQESNVFMDLSAGLYEIIARDKAYIFNVSEKKAININQPNRPSSNGSSSKTKVKHPVDTAIQKGQKNSEGKTIGTLKVNDKNKKGVYEQDIPKEFFNNKDKIIQIQTPEGSVALPDDMFDKVPNDNISVNIEQVSPDVLPGVLKTIFKDKPIIDINIIIGGKKTKWKSDDKEIIISIPYTLEDNEKNNPNKIIAVFIDDSGNIIPITSSNYDYEKGAIIFRTKHTSHYSVQYVNKSFDDIGTYKWAKESIETLAARGIINGVSDKKFAPANNITRADFVLLVTRFFGLSSNNTTNFDDVMEGTYYYDAVMTAKSLGIVNGIGENSFKPKNLISRQDMMVIIKRTLEITGQDDKLILNSSKRISDFLDNEKVSNYATESVDYLISKNIVSGNGNNINPKSFTKRAEVAALLYKLHSVINK